VVVDAGAPSACRRQLIGGTMAVADPAGLVIAGADFDHVAVAAESETLLEPRYAQQLGGLPLAGGQPPGFLWAQLEFVNGMVVEMLEPRRVEDNDFLRRFLDRNRAGPHHLTFKVPDLPRALEAVETAGYHPVAVDDSDPDWKEAFLHPSEVPGVVVQLAESHERHVHPRHDPSSRAASLTYVAHAVRSIEDGLKLFERLLGGARGPEGGGPGFRWVELRWSGPGRLRLLEPTGPGDVDTWLGDRAGRLHHLAFVLAEPASVPDAVADGLLWLVEPEANQGTRLVLVADASILASSTPAGR